MGLRFFADHCVSNTIMQTRPEARHKVVRLRERLPVESRDGDIIAKAQQLDTILLSLNGDFADAVSYCWLKSTESGYGNKGGTILTLLKPPTIMRQTIPSVKK
jgi:hypothetical protein